MYKVIAPIVFLLSVCGTARAQGVISGPSPVCAGVNNTYSVSNFNIYYSTKVTLSGGGLASNNASTATNVTTISAHFSVNGTITWMGYEYDPSYPGPTHTLLMETVTMNVTAYTPGTISAASSVCPGTTIALSASGGSGTSFNWQSSPSGQNTWSTFTTTSSTGGVTAPAITQATDFRRVLTGCSTNNVSNVATTSVNASPTAGTISGSATLCSGSVVTIASTQNSQPTAAYTIQWQQSVNGGAWTDITSARGTDLYTYTPPAITQNTSFRRATLWSCDANFRANSNSVDYTVVPQSSTGTLSSSVSTVCASGSVQLVASSLVSSATQWQYRYSDNGGSSYTAWTNFSTGASPQSFSVSSGSADRLYQFQVVAQNSVCAAVTSNTQSVTVRSGNGGSLTSSLIEAYGSTNVNFTLSGYAGTFQKWQLSTNGGSTWSDAPGTNTSPTYTYNNITTTTLYRAIIPNGSCTNYSPVVTVTISNAPTIVFSGTPALAVGSTLTFSSSKNVGNTDYYSYQWQKDGVAISGATQSTYVVKEPGNYKLQVKASATSAAATTGNYTIYPIGSQPDNLNNTLVTTVLRKAGAVTGTNLYTAMQPKDVAQQVTFYDPLYRPIQQIAIGQSPAQHDVVQPVAYDSVSTVQYLPYVTSGRDGVIKNTAIVNGTYAGSDQYLFYQQASQKIANSTMPFAKGLTENSSFRRTLQQGAPGTDWQPGSHAVKSELHTNVASDVKIWTAAGPGSYYAANTLAVSKVIDEHGNAALAYIDRAGRTVLKRQQMDATIEGMVTPFLETYYVYDQHNNLVLQVPPKAVAKLNAGTAWSTTFRDQWCFTYLYDERDQLVEKKTPDAIATYFVYDRLGRLVLSQDGNLRSQNKWTFLKYDAKGRAVMSGLYTNAIENTRGLMKTKVDALYANTSDPWYETRATTLHGYSNASFPTTNQDNSALDIYSVNYYDTYDFDFNGTDDYAYVAQGLTGENPQGGSFGLATGSKQIVVGTSTWLYSYVFYDIFSQVLQARSNNHLSTSIDNLTTVGRDFEGHATVIKNYHNAGGTNQVTTLIKSTYDLGRLTQVTQSINGSADQLVAQYEYNELGQVVDKKLHNTGGANFMQSVDYRYNIRGWLSSINNAQLTNDGTINDETNDYFGMELFYNTADAGLGSAALYNGAVSAVKWKGVGQSSGTAGRGSYKFTYDKAGQLLTSTYQEHNGVDWTAEVNTLNENMSYDHNGNVLTLLRNQNLHGLSGITVTSTPQTIDNLTYTYALGNALTKVEDASADTTGFKNGVNNTTEYLYNTNGYLTKDDNKGIASIAYNALGKAQQIDYTNGGRSTYTYDAGGNKLTVRYEKPVGTLKSTTDYVNGFVYENGTLSFFGSPEGKVVKNGSTWEYQYAIADHQGNTRVVFSSVTPAAQSITATFEGDANDNASQFTVNANFVVPFVGANHTTGGSKVVKMNQTYKIGPAKSLKVFPGDKVDLEVWEYHEGGSGYGTTATSSAALTTLVANVFGGVSGGMGESGKIFTGVNNAITNFATNSNQGDSQPAAYLNYILFDLNYKVLDVGARLAPSTTFTKQQLVFPTLNIKEPGILFVYLSYDDDSNNWVYFDDLKVKYTPTNVVQYNEYYPFGMQTANSWTRTGSKNNFLYNAGSELNSSSGLYETSFRGYDPALGRFHQVDPMADISGSLTPYHYAANNPVLLNDPTGLHEGDWNSYHPGQGNYPYLDGPIRNGHALYRYDPADYGINMDVYKPGYWVDHAYIDDEGVLTVETKFVPKGQANSSSESDVAQASLYSPESDGFDLVSDFLGFKGLVADLGLHNWSKLSNKAQWKTAYDTHKFLKTKGFHINTSAIKNGVPKLLKAAGTGLGIAAGLLTVGEVIYKSEVKVSNILDATITGLSFIPGAGWIIGGGYFVGDLLTRELTGKSIGDHLDDAVGGPLLDWEY